MAAREACLQGRAPGQHPRSTEGKVRKRDKRGLGDQQDRRELSSAKALQGISSQGALQLQTRKPRSSHPKNALRRAAASLTPLPDALLDKARQKTEGGSTKVSVPPLPRPCSTSPSYPPEGPPPKRARSARTSPDTLETAHRLRSVVMVPAAMPVPIMLAHQPAKLPKRCVIHSYYEMGPVVLSDSSPVTSIGRRERPLSKISARVVQQVDSEGASWPN